VRTRSNTVEPLPEEAEEEAEDDGGEAGPGRRDQESK